jgi:hypothetical protein
MNFFFRPTNQMNEEYPQITDAVNKVLRAFSFTEVEVDVGASGA